MSSTHFSSTASATSDQGRQYLTFLVGNEEYGMDILKVQEIKGFAPPTSVPNTPAYIRGVMNLRGTVIPVLDLRVKFNLPDPQYTKFTVIVVANLGERTIGLVVDAVSDVLEIRDSDVEPPPDLVTDAQTAFITGMVTKTERLIMLMDVDQVINPEALPLDQEILGDDRSEPEETESECAST